MLIQQPSPMLNLAMTSLVPTMVGIPQNIVPRPIRKPAMRMTWTRTRVPTLGGRGDKSARVSDSLKSSGANSSRSFCSSEARGTVGGIFDS